MSDSNSDDSNDSDDTYYEKCSRYKRPYRHARYYERYANTKINYQNPHYVKWCLSYRNYVKCNDPFYADIYEFPNYEEACKYVRIEFSDGDNNPYNPPGDSYKWMIIDLFTLEVVNDDDINHTDEFYQKEKEYKKEFALAINKVLASKAFTLGLALKLSMRNCGFNLS